MSQRFKRPQSSAPSILFQPLGKRVEISDKTNVLEVALSGAIPLEASCGGMGSCTTCRVIVESDLADVSPRTEVEAEMAEARGFSPRERLSCQLKPCANLVVKIPPARKAQNPT